MLRVLARIESFVNIQKCSMVSRILPFAVCPRNLWHRSYLEFSPTLRRSSRRNHQDWQCVVQVLLQKPRRRSVDIMISRKARKENFKEARRRDGLRPLYPLGIAIVFIPKHQSYDVFTFFSSLHLGDKSGYAWSTNFKGPSIKRASFKPSINLNPARTIRRISWDYSNNHRS
jgi:hypothetical protein